jgi:hypothetical protein
MLLGAIVGDVLHNLRSALDSVAWETCQRAGVSINRESSVQFPVSSRPAQWKQLAESQLPNLSPPYLQIFKELQPWYQDEIARNCGIEVDLSATERHPMSRLHDMARRDRHRVPHPILARAGDTWLGTPDGVQVDAIQADPPPWKPDDVILKWRIDPVARAADVAPEGEAILAFSEQEALYGQSALDELRQMVEVVTHALRRVEFEILEVVTQQQVAELDELRTSVRAAQEALESMQRPAHIIDADYIDRCRDVAKEAESARTRASLAAGARCLSRRR